jgi:hypothetical protein
LIELAQEKLKAIREGGWIELWVVGTDCTNDFWFADYAEAAACLAKCAERNVTKGYHEELRLDQQRFRHAEAARLVKYTKEPT